MYTIDDIHRIKGTSAKNTKNMANYFISSRTQQVVIDSFNIQLAPKCLINQKWFKRKFKMLWAREISKYFFSFLFWVEFGFLKTFRWYANQDVHMDLSELRQPVHQPGGTFVCFLFDTERLPRRTPPSLQVAGGSSSHTTHICTDY
jgi:hypothetical protein